MSGIPNGADVTGSVDLTSDLVDTNVPNNGAPPAPAGTRIAGTEPAAVPPAGEPPKPDVNQRSIRETLTAAFADKAGAPAAQEGAQVRDPVTGQFAPAAAAAPAGGVPPVAAPAAQAFQPPASMSPVEAQHFASLPAEMQQYVARTMERVETDAVRYREYDALEQLIGPRRNPWAMQGMQPAQAVNQLFALSDFAGQNPPEFIQWFAGQHGIDLEALSQGVPEIDPHIQALQNQVGQLTTQLQGMTQGQQQHAHNQVVHEITAFGAEVGSDGKLLRPYFDELGRDVLPFIQAIKAENPNMPNRDVLNAAYDRACWGSPTVRTKMQSAADAERLAGQRETAMRAQAAGSSVVGAPLSGASTPNNAGDGSIRGILAAQLAAS